MAFAVKTVIPENPSPESMDVQELEPMNPVTTQPEVSNRDTARNPPVGKVLKLRKEETVQVKQLASHELSAEQQLYYKEITEACVGFEEALRAKALQSLATDPVMAEMLPQLCCFIADGVVVNVTLKNLTLLHCLMNMVNALLQNENLYLMKYLHQLIPSVLTCIVSKQLGMQPEFENHWALREFAAYLMSRICKNFNNSTNNILTRVIELFSTAIFNQQSPLTTIYGGLEGLWWLGAKEVVINEVLPKVREISDRLDATCRIGRRFEDKRSCGRIKNLLTKLLVATLVKRRQPPDVLDEYLSEYGTVGLMLHKAVVNVRNHILSSLSQPSTGLHSRIQKTTPD